MTSPEKLATPDSVIAKFENVLALIKSGNKAPEAIADFRAEVTRLATGRQTPDGWVLAPAWRGYALLGTRNYLLNHSAAPTDPELGAEFFITFASEADKSGNRQVGESCDTDLESGPIEAKDMVLRIGFTCHEAVDALTDQLALMRKENFPDALPAAPGAAQGEVK